MNGGESSYPPPENPGHTILIGFDVPLVPTLLPTTAGCVPLLVDLSAQPSKLTNSVVPHGVREGEDQADDAQAIGIEMLGKGEDQLSRDLLPGIQLGVRVRLPAD